MLFAHAFGQRYELPIPLVLFVLGGAGIVFVSFLLILPRKIKAYKETGKEERKVANTSWWGLASVALLALLIVGGIGGSQSVPENILPTLFWLITWIAIPLSCGVIGDWTQQVNPFLQTAQAVDKKTLRQKVLGRSEPFSWPSWLGWWPAVALYFVIVCGELIFNQAATKPAVTAVSLLAYFLVSTFLGLLYGKAWLERGEVFSVLLSTWGKLGFWRFGAPGVQGFAGGLQSTFEASPSRVIFVLLLLISVAFDGLLSTPFWNHIQHRLPYSFSVGTLNYELFAVGCFLVLVCAVWLVFSSFAAAVSRVGAHNIKATAALAGLLPSLLPISFGYLLAHNIEYLLINGQLLFPLIGNPIGKDSWPLHLPFPFNDSFEPHIHMLPSSFYWYFSVAVIVAVHVMAVLLAHKHLGTATKDVLKARRSEYPWIVAMVCYTMLSLWLLAQPLVKEKNVSYAPIVRTGTTTLVVNKDEYRYT